MKKGIIIVLVFLVLGLQGLFAQEEFTWKLAVVKNGIGVPFEAGIGFNNEESFIIKLESESDCYVYLLLEQANGSYKIQTSQAKARIPQKDISITLKPPSGVERLYVVTSSGEQRQLQTAIEAYQKDGSERNATILGNRLLQIRDPKGENPGSPIDFSEGARAGTAAEPIAATKYSGSSVYVKTIVISH